MHINALYLVLEYVRSEMGPTTYENRYVYDPWWSDYALSLLAAIVESRDLQRQNWRSAQSCVYAHLDGGGIGMPTSWGDFAE